MEMEQSIWQITLTALIAGILIGVLVYRYFTASENETDKVKAELEDARAELENYKAGVGQHFDKTGELVNELAQNYVKVYKHLAEGAETLSAGKTFPELLQQQNKLALDVAEDPDVVTTVEDDSMTLENSESSEKAENTGRLPGESV